MNTNTVHLEKFLNVLNVLKTNRNAYTEGGEYIYYYIVKLKLIYLIFLIRFEKKI